MSDREDALIAAIAEDQPGAREVYRDWLEQNGDVTWLPDDGNVDRLVARTCPEQWTKPSAVKNTSDERIYQVKHHQLSTIYFGWGSGIEFESHSMMFARGPLGFARLSQRPRAARAILAIERPTDPHEYLATILAEAFGDYGGPDTMDRPDRMLAMRAGLLTKHDLETIDSGGSFAKFTSTGWAPVRKKLAGVTGDTSKHGFSIVYCEAVSVGDDKMRFDRVTVTVDVSCYALSARREAVGTLVCEAHHYPVVGRPYQTYRAPLARRDDWT